MLSLSVCRPREGQATPISVLPQAVNEPEETNPVPDKPATVEKLSNGETANKPDDSHRSDLAAAAASVVCSYLLAEHASEREAVQQFLKRAAAACDGNLHFFSAPGGRGRAVLVEGAPVSQRDGFVLVSSSSAELRGTAAAAVATTHVNLLRAALEQGVVADGCVAASAIRSKHALDGILMLEAPPPKTSDNPLPKTMLERAGVAGLRLAISLWGAVLGERLHNIRQAIECRAALKSLASVNSTLANVSDTRSSSSYLTLLNEASRMIPKDLLQGGSTPERLALWFHDSCSNSMILNNTGHLDGIRVPCDSSIVGESCLQPGERVSCIPDVSSHPRYNPSLDDKTGFKTGCCICIPFSLNVDSSTSVIQWTYARENAKGEVASHADNFDLACAEDVQKSALPMMLDIRNSCIKVLQEGRQRESIQAVCAHFGTATSVSSLIELLEVEVTDVMDCARCTFFFLDDVREEIWAPPTAERPQGIRSRIGEGVVGHVAKKALEKGPDAADVLISNNPKSCSYWKGDVEEGFVTRNLMTAPVLSVGGDRKLLGVVQILNRNRLGSSTQRQSVAAVAKDGEDGFTPGDVKLMEILVTEMGSHLHRLLAELLWTKSQMDIASRVGNGDCASIMQEYYNMPDMVPRGSQPGIMAPSDLKSLKASSEEMAATLLESAEIRAQRVDVHSWRVSYWEMQEADEFYLLLSVMRHFGVLNRLFVPLPCLWEFFLAIKASYNQLPYHNFQHAVAAVHYSFKITEAAQLSTKLNSLDLMALFAAALCHDADHRGCNNAFEVVSRSELALRYNDISPLENHHCATMFQIAFSSEKNKRNIFLGLDIEAYAKIRHLIVGAILATDMAHHGEHIKKAQLVDLSATDDQAPPKFLVEFVLHAADISNPFMPPDISARWSSCIADEFSLQVDRERSLGLPVTKFMDGLGEPVAAAKSTLGFINFVIRPFCGPMFQLFTGLEELRNFLEENRAAAEEAISAGTASI